MSTVLAVLTIVSLFSKAPNELQQVNACEDESVGTVGSNV